MNTDLAKIPHNLIHPKDHQRVLTTLSAVSEGKKWADIVSTGLSLPEYAMLKRKSKEFAVMAKEAEAIRDDVRQGIREEEAHKRAVDGETVPVYSQSGKYCGEYQKRSDKLMEVMLRAHNPKKYGTYHADIQPPITLNVAIGIPRRTNDEE